MNKQQQEIKEFHELIKPTLEKVLAQYNKKNAQSIYNNVIKPCRKLIQKCSFKSTDDANRLCSLVYWLYIYGHKKLALEICELTHSVDFVFDDWCSAIINMYGLEIRIARELFGERRKSNNSPRFLDYYFSKRVRKSIRYPQILREEEISDCSAGFVEYVLLSALYDMIGKGETGLYTKLNDNWERIEEAITEYISLLK